jgi:D-amino-acid dehydrogenase
LDTAPVAADRRVRYHVDLQRSAGDPTLPIFIKEARVIATPLDAALRFGGTLELDGLNLRINPGRVEAIKRAAYPVFADSPA